MSSNYRSRVSNWAGRCSQATLQAALAYRAYNLGVYGIELPMIKPWTSRPAVTDAVLNLVDSATKVATVSGGNSAGKDVVDMLPELATLLFACVQERLDWLARQVLPVSHIYLCQRALFWPPARLQLMIQTRRGTDRS